MDAELENIIKSYIDRETRGKNRKATKKMLKDLHKAMDEQMEGTCFIMGEDGFKPYKREK